MAEKKIVIHIDDKGGIEAETFGITGANCIDELDRLMKDIALEGTTAKKNEYFEQETHNSATVINKND